jgi:hypothetical protein
LRDEIDELEKTKQEALFNCEEKQREIERKDDEYTLKTKDLTQQIEVHTNKIDWFRDN